MLLLVALVGLASATFKYEWNGDRFYRLDPSPLQMHMRQSLDEHFDIMGYNEKNMMEIRVPQAVQPRFESMSKKLKATEITDEVVAYYTWFFSPEANQVCRKSVAECKRVFYEQYQEHDAIVSYVDDLIAAYPSLMAPKIWGETYQGRDIVGATITGTAGGNNKPVIFYFCGEHAREWLPPMFCVYLLENLATGYGSNNRVTNILNAYNVHVLPVYNVDGYIWSHTNDNMWRKNRRPEGTCVGTDLNRNYPYQWNTGGSSPQPCSDTYHGGDPLSEVETQSLDAYARSTNIVIQTDVHAYGQMWMHPWGYTYALCPDHQQQLVCGNAAADAIFETNGLRFDTGSIANVIYIASGSSCDYFYGEHDVVFSYAPEVRGNQFQPPASNIDPSNAELWNAFLAQVECVSDFRSAGNATIAGK